METASLRRENKKLKEKDNIDFELIGQKLTFRNFVSNLNKVAKANSRVLISGAAGSGKEAAARYIHENSRQAIGQFIVLNCSTSNQSDLERMLFGLEDRDGVKSVGALEKANGGTIFLDEVSELPYDLQGKLLKVLVDNSVSRLGSDKKIDLDLRFISSTSRSI